MKMAFATVCEVATGVSSFKAYNAAILSDVDVLLLENVEALSDDDDGNYYEHQQSFSKKCKIPEDATYCTKHWRCKWTKRKEVQVAGACKCIGPESYDCCIKN